MDSSGMLNLTHIATMNAKISGGRKISNDIHVRQIDKLKDHMDTLDETSEYREVLDFVSIEKKCSRLTGVTVLTTTNRAIDDAVRYTRKEIKRMILEEQAGDFEADILMMIDQSADHIARAAAFFSIPTKEIFVIRNIEGRKPPKGKRKVSKKKNKKPSRFTISQWNGIRNRSVLAHELFHMHMDMKSHSSNEMLHEEYAYGNMISWCRKEGLTDKEIAQNFLISFGYMVASSKHPSLYVSKQWSALEKKANEEAMALIEQHTNRKGNKEEDKEVDLEPYGGRFDLEF